MVRPPPRFVLLSNSLLRTKIKSNESKKTKSKLTTIKKITEKKKTKFALENVVCHMFAVVKYRIACFNIKF